MRGNTSEFVRISGADRRHREFRFAYGNRDSLRTWLRHRAIAIIFFIHVVSGCEISAATYKFTLANGCDIGDNITGLEAMLLDPPTGFIAAEAPANWQKNHNSFYILWTANPGYGIPPDSERAGFAFAVEVDHVKFKLRANRAGHYGSWHEQTWDARSEQRDFTFVALDCSDIPIPTLSEWALIIFSVLLLGLMTYYLIKRRRLAETVV